MKTLYSNNAGSTDARSRLQAGGERVLTGLGKFRFETRDTHESLSEPMTSTIADHAAPSLVPTKSIVIV
ncbi:MAG: hypothetical protein AAF539_04055 [Planctomycetota bacterium]